MKAAYRHYDLVQQLNQLLHVDQSCCRQLNKVSVRDWLKSAVTILAVNGTKLSRWTFAFALERVLRSRSVASRVSCQHMPRTMRLPREHPSTYLNFNAVTTAAFTSLDVSNSILYHG
jgi:hypothetical protein